MFRFAVLAAVLFLAASPAHALWAGKPVACTKDARVCPDGSSVGRTGPDCQFAPCPDGTVPGDDAPGFVEGSAPGGEQDGAVQDGEDQGGGIVTHDVTPGVVEGHPGTVDDTGGNSSEIKPSPIPHPAPGGGQRMCTMEAKICPDGTGVGRTGPNCEFAPCPGEEKK